MPTPAAFDGRFRILDSYRFIAASLVALYHFNKNDVLGLTRISPMFENFRLGVDFFFVLSGFVIARVYLDHIHLPGSYRRFMWKRLVRLYPLHLLTLLVGIVGGLVVGHKALQSGTNPEVFSSYAILANLTLTHSLGVTSYGSFNIPSWSISAEMFVYLLFPLFAALALRLPASVNLGLVAVYVILTILVRNQLGLRDWTLTWYDFGALRAVPTFFAGVIIARLLATRLSGFAPSVIWAHLSFAAALVCMHFDWRDEFVLVAFCATVLLAAAAEMNGYQSRLQAPAFVHLGDASYALYMLHMPIKAGIFAVLGKLAGTTLLPMWSAAILSYGVSVLLALLTYRHFELPVKAFLLRFGSRHVFKDALPEAVGKRV